jgi:hypothetical protein
MRYGKGKEEKRLTRDPSTRCCATPASTARLGVPRQAPAWARSRRNLYTGDYSLEGYYDNKLFVIERKGSVAELVGNITQKEKWDDFKQELERLEEFRHPFVVCEFPLPAQDLPGRQRHPEADGGRSMRVKPQFLLKRLEEILAPLQDQVRSSPTPPSSAARSPPASSSESSSMSVSPDRPSPPAHREWVEQYQDNRWLNLGDTSSLESSTRSTAARSTTSRTPTSSPRPDAAARILRLHLQGPLRQDAGPVPAGHPARAVGPGPSPCSSAAAAWARAGFWPSTHAAGPVSPGQQNRHRRRRLPPGQGRLRLLPGPVGARPGPTATWSGPTSATARGGTSTAAPCGWATASSSPCRWATAPRFAASAPTSSSPTSSRPSRRTSSRRSSAASPR